MKTIPWPVYQLKEEPSAGTPLVLARVRAGFPSPADDYVELWIDLNKQFVPKPHATFFVKVEGDSMLGARIKAGDWLIVVRYEKPTLGRVVIGTVYGEFTVKRLGEIGGRLCLLPESDDPAYQPLFIRDDMDFEVWGVVKHVIHEP
jgi:DNA polymerase V